jgi:hypothetical protein
MSETDGAGGKKPARWKRILGWSSIAFGFLNILDLSSPIPVPTVGPVAVIAGLFFIGLGGTLLISDAIPWKRLFQLGKASLPPPKPATQAKAVDPLLPVKILRLSKQNAGLLTVSMVAMELNVSLDEAEAGLEECVRHGQATADFDMAKEITDYRFHEHAGPEAIEGPEES